MNPIPSFIELDRLIQQLRAQCLRQDAPPILESEWKRLTHCSQYLHDSCHATSLELGQISSALAGLLTLLDQSEIEHLDREQAYCLLEPFTRRLQQSYRQLQELS
ncbi:MULTISPECIES: DUF1484 family protein [Chromobacterium]|uniref:DUF1484 family protein n=1 Tax=Chromobacterium TaxID=535 RepID=UPI000310A806|nr:MULTISPECIES: DUF1484 family protein [Chromobacterium]MDH0344605.1 DUF1484 family protein [Chromobacterium haemolyticum]PTU71568.1 DUF1484 domain-containing protein [Chromobacterium haemolyticum]QOD83579.1 DUF1484 family protein [Chromobacterium haemolyticum]